MYIVAYPAACALDSHCHVNSRFMLRGDQPWDFFGRNDTKAETPVLWPLHEKSWLIGKDSVAGRDWGQEEKGTTEDKMAGWHHWLDGCWVWVDSESWWWTGRPGVLRFMGSQRVEHDWATELNWTDAIFWGWENLCSLASLQPLHIEVLFFPWSSITSGDAVNENRKKVK